MGSQIPEVLLHSSLHLILTGNYASLWRLIPALWPLDYQTPPTTNIRWRMLRFASGGCDIVQLRQQVPHLLVVRGEVDKELALIGAVGLACNQRHTPAAVLFEEADHMLHGGPRRRDRKG